VVAASRARAARWNRKATARVVRPWADATATPGGGALVSPLFLNCRLIPAGSRGGFRRVEMPDGRRGWVREAAIATGRRRPPDLLTRIRGLTGVSYLWGGRTALGFDCSGFTQQVLFENGIRLPRDARDQFRASRALEQGEEPRPGDLVFFRERKAPPSHVGLALGGSYFAHARGRVRISSLDHRNPLCDSEIIHQFAGVRRPPVPR